MKWNASPRYPGGRGALWGVAASLVGFAASYTLVSTRLSQFLETTVSTESSSFTLAELTQSAHVPVWKWANLAFYSSHAIIHAAIKPAGRS